MLSSKDSLNIGASYLGKANFNNGFSSFSRLGTLSGKTLAMYIKSLFANNEVGFAYDPNDLSTLYQDAAGTIPVTGAGQPVGLVLDKSKGLVLGIEKLSNNDFSNSGVGWVIAGGVPTYVGGVVTLTSQAGDIGEIYQDISVPAGRWVKITARAKYSNAQSFGLNVYDGGGYANYKGAIAFSTSFEEKSGYFFSTTGSLRVRMRLSTSTAIGTGDVDYISVKELPGNHAYQTNSASRPILRRNATTGAYYLEFDGTDDFLQTANIDFTATDKVSLFAAYKNILPLASYKLLLELSGNSDTTNGTFGIFAPALGSDVGFSVSSRGTSQVKNNINNQPITQGLILSCSLSISPPLNVNKVNGVQAANNTAPQGTGNYGNYPLYIGRRAGNTNSFNGHLYSLIGIGRLTTDSETIALEKSIAKNVGVTL